MHIFTLAQSNEIASQMTGTIVAESSQHRLWQEQLAAESFGQASGFALSWEEYELDRTQKRGAGSVVLGERSLASSELHRLEQLDDITRALQEGCLDLMTLIELEP